MLPFLFFPSPVDLAIKPTLLTHHNFCGINTRNHREKIMANIISEESVVRCEICGMETEMLTSTHLKFKHGISFKEYREQFPNAPTITRAKDTARRENISKKTKGRIAHNKGKKTSDEQKKKQSDTMKKKYSSGELVHWNTGNTWDESVKQKISESVSKVTFTKEEMDAINAKKAETVKAKVDAGWVSPLKGRELSGEHKQKAIETIKAVNQARIERLWNIVEEKVKEAGLTLLDVDRGDGNRLYLSCNTCKTNFSFQSQIFRDSKQKGIEICPQCYPRMISRSKGETELFNFILGLFPSAIANDRSLLGGFGKEIDIYIPEKNVAIEYNGLYYHSSEVHSIPRNLQDKLTRCTTLGIRLISIIEDEWKYKQDIVKSRLKQILGVSSDRTIYARNTTISQITHKQANDFLNGNHIQGGDVSKIRYGAFCDGELLAVMTFKPTNFTKGGDGSEFEISRFAVKVSTSLPGIASKLFMHFVREYNPEEIISYADSRWSTGNLYKALGFEHVHQSPPNYWYFLPNEGIRYHRSGFMKHMLIEDGADPNKTEREIMRDKGYYSIYDCGSSKWKWIKTSVDVVE